MSHFHLTRRLEIGADQAFAIAADVGSYKEFLPLVKRSTVRGLTALASGKTRFLGDLEIKVARLGVSENFTSEVETDAELRRVTATSSDGPVKSLAAVWDIAPVSETTCDVTIKVDYVLRSTLLQLAAGGLVDYAAQKILNAFEARALKLYGSRAS